MDLDGDGDDEWVIVQLRGWSNGISLSSWDITVLEEAGARPAQVRASHFQPGHFLHGEAGGCDLLQTHRLRLDDPYWGEGNYFSGRRLAWSGEDFAVVGEDFAARRLTERFLRSRDMADVLGWFASDDAKARPAGQW
jgi:hypothetical protein